MSVAKVQEALEKLDALDDLLQDISPARISQWSWEQSTHEPLKSMRRVLENELVHQEKDALARYMQSNNASSGLATTSPKCTCPHLEGRHFMGCPSYTANR
jgi:hypothetical protein